MVVKILVRKYGIGRSLQVLDKGYVTFNAFGVKKNSTKHFSHKLSVKAIVAYTLQISLNAFSAK